MRTAFKFCTRIVKYVWRALIIVALFTLIFLNVRLYHRPTFKKNDQTVINVDLLAELRSLRSVMESGAAVDMQKLFPEGYLFMNALYGLSWCELASAVPASSDLYQEAHREIQRAYESVDSEAGRIVFDESLPLPYGAYYSGWSNYFLGKKLSIENETDRDPTEIGIFKERCERIAESISNTNTPYPASYAFGAWPADVAVCVSSLSIHDQIFESKYGTIIQNWVKSVSNNLDERGLVPHSVQVESGKVREAARGSSMSLLLIFLLDIDRDFANQQFRLYKEFFLQQNFGLPGIREYPKGTSGAGDVDSGPVILDIGAAASIVGIQTMHLYNERCTSLALRNGIESFGLPLTFFGKKQYLFGLMPMADAFIIWSHSKADLMKEASHCDNSWRYPFHGYSLIPITCVLLLLASNVGLLSRKKSIS